MEPEQTPAHPVIVQACYGCHAKPDTDAQGLTPFTLTAEADIAAKLHAYRSGKLSGTVMNRISRGYTHSELEQLAALMATSNASQTSTSQ